MPRNVLSFRVSEKGVKDVDKAAALCEVSRAAYLRALLAVALGSTAVQSAIRERLKGTL